LSCFDAPVLPPLFHYLATALLFSACCAGLAPSSVHAATLRASIQVETGVFYLWNEGPGDFNLTAYTISAPNQNLISGNWLSIANFYDGNSGGLIDADDNWFVLTQNAATLSEAVFTGDGGFVPPLWPVSLGQLRLPGSTDLVTMVAVEGALPPVPVAVNFIGTGDYDADGDVDIDDYAVWRSHFGTISAGLFLVGDGNGDGRVDAADYTVWRDHLGTVTMPASLLLAPLLVPEPIGLHMMTLLAGWLLWRCQALRRLSANGGHASS
jgi:hypothetical protein